MIYKNWYTSIYCLFKGNNHNKYSSDKSDDFVEHLQFMKRKKKQNRKKVPNNKYILKTKCYFMRIMHFMKAHYIVSVDSINKIHNFQTFNKVFCKGKYFVLI